MNEDIQRHHTNERTSKIVQYNGMIFLSGQTAFGSPKVNEGIDAQVREVLSRIDGLLAEVGSDKSRILSTTIYLRNLADFAAMNAIWNAWVAPGTAPARATVEAKLAAESLLVEMSVVAAQPQK